MKKIIAMLLSLLLVLSLAIPAGAVTTGKWDFESGYQHAQDTTREALEGRTVTYDYAGGWMIQRELWRWQVTTGAAYTENGTHIIPEAVPWRLGCRFGGWLAPNGVVYQPGDLIQGTGDVRLVAVWEVRK